MHCRFCKSNLEFELVDLINSPPSNSYLTLEQLSEPEIYFPLKVLVCENCFLVQIAESKKASEIFDSNYAYFSSYSTTWVEHGRRYVEMMCERFILGADSQVIEIASNDGYLLQHFQEKNVPVLGIEPTSSTAAVAREKGIETITEFFGVALAQNLVASGRAADLLLGNNVLAHVPDLNDFVGGLKIALKPDGVITMEFPHLKQLIDHCQFDTIYHEHFSYLSFTTVARIFAEHGLKIFDVEEIPTHGGSLRIFAAHRDDDGKHLSPNVERLLDVERDAGMLDLAYYSHFQAKVDQIKNELVRFLLEQKRLGKIVVAYGAAAKGNTLLNYCGIRSDLLKFVVDASPHKQGKFLPGSHIAIKDESAIRHERPDFVLILPWNLMAEIAAQLAYLSEWNAKLVTAIPKLIIFAAG